MIAPPRWACVSAFAIIGFLLRAGFAIAWPTVQRPDETFQNLEPAYRLLTGSGVISWEWRDGIRSWLFPDILAAIMGAGRLLHAPPIQAVAVVLAALATSGVIAATLLGWRRAGLSGALLCGAIVTIWPDLVYFDPKPLLEVQAGLLLFVAATLASFERTQRPAVAIGLLLGFAFDLRFQLAPALAVVAVGTAWGYERRVWPRLLAAAVVPVLLLGLLDWATWGSPFQSIWKNFQVNLVENRSASYGVEPFDWYGTALLHRYGLAAIPLALCFGLGLRAAPIPAATAAIVVASHSLIPHKELSFIYAALPCGCLVAGLGAARWLAAARLRVLAVGLLLCAAVSGLAASTARPFREPSARPDLRALWSMIRLQPDLCGLGLYGAGRFPWHLTPGYVGLQRPIPIYELLGPEALAAAAQAYNYLIVDTGSVSPPAADPMACRGQFCLLRREQACIPAPDVAINAVLQRSGQ